MSVFSIFKSRVLLLFIIAVTFIFILSGISKVNGASRYSYTSGNWNSTSTWSTTSGGGPGASVPVAGDVVYIQAGDNVTVTAAAACTSITFTGNGATLTVNSTFTLTVSGAVTVNSSASTSYSSTITGAGTLTCASLIVGSNVTPSSDRTTTLTCSITTLTISGNLSLYSNDNSNRQNDARFYLSTGTVTVNGSITSTNEDTSDNTSTLTMATGSQDGTLILGGVTPFNLGAGTNSITLSGTATLVKYNYSGAQTVYPVAYTDLTLAGSGAKTTTGVTVNGVLSMEGTATASVAPTYGSSATLQYNTATSRTAGVEWITPFAATGGVIIANTGNITLNAAKVFNASVPLTINSGATLSTANYQLTFGGNFINNGGTFTAGSSPIVIANTMTSQSIAGFSTTGLVTMSKTAGTATFQGNVNSTGLTANGSGGTLNLGAGLTHVVTGAVTITGSTFAGGSSTISLTGNWTNNTGTFTPGTSSVNFNGTITQTIGGNTSTTFNDITINNASSGITLARSAIINGILNLTGGILTSGTNTVTVTNSSTSAVTGGSGTSFVNGPLIWSLASGQNYTFLIGKGATYLPFSLSGITGTSPRIRVEAFTGNTGGSASSPLTSLSTTEYWLASVVSGTYSGGSVSLTRQISLNGFEAIGRNTSTLNGAYSNLNGTISGTSIINSDNTGTSLGYFVLASKASITTGTLSSSFFCPGTSVSVPYTKSGTFNAGNVFTAQLSNASGSFTSPTNIGSLTSQNSGTISATIPSGQANGSGYRIRVVSSNPSITGSNNGVDLSIGAPTITGASPGSRCGPGIVTLSAIASAGTINWYQTSTGGSSLGTGSLYTTPSLSSDTTYYVDATANGCTSPTRTPVEAIIISTASITAEGGGTFCSGDTITLTCSGINIENQYWEGPNNFYSIDSTIVLNNVNATMSGSYTVTGSAVSGLNLLVNGDFELGNTGFSSDYTNSTDLWPEGRYAVVADPNSVHANFSHCADHTPSGSLHMVINGATVPGSIIWAETVTIVPNTDYQFTYWFQGVIDDNVSTLQLFANGVAVGPAYDALTPSCTWLQFIYNWNSGSNTSVYLSLLDQNTIASGNDFSLDDIVFQQACYATASV
ncbi:MAG: hypothetical protein HGB12_03735, partial [Bacteroidetes bacterium]|nr:hypothetical protein [Bacteroidota bacterium]